MSSHLGCLLQQLLVLGELSLYHAAEPLLNGDWDGCGYGDGYGDGNGDGKRMPVVSSTYNGRGIRSRFSSKCGYVDTTISLVWVQV